MSPSNEPGVCVDAGSLPDQDAPLVQLAAQKFSGRLAVSFQNIDPAGPADPYPVQAAQTFGTAIGYQTNDYDSLQRAACSGGSQHPGPCTSTSYLALLEIGIYPLGKLNSLKAQYIEVLPPDAIAFPDVFTLSEKVTAAAGEDGGRSAARAV